MMLRSACLAALASLALLSAGCTAGVDAEGEEAPVAAESDLTTYRWMNHTCGLHAITWLANGDIAAQQSTCPEEEASGESKAPLTLWHPYDPKCQTWDLGCRRATGRMQAVWDVTRSGNAFLAATANTWAVASAPHLFEQAKVSWHFTKDIRSWAQPRGGFSGKETSWNLMTINHASLSADAKLVALVGGQSDLYVADLLGRSGHLVVGTSLSFADLWTKASWGGDKRLAFVTRGSNGSKLTVATSPRRTPPTSCSPT